MTTKETLSRLDPECLALIEENERLREAVKNLIYSRPAKRHQPIPPEPPKFPTNKDWPEYETRLEAYSSRMRAYFSAEEEDRKRWRDAVKQAREALQPKKGITE